MTPEELKQSIKQNQEERRKGSLEALPEILSEFNCKLSSLTKENEAYYASVGFNPCLDADLITQEVCNYFRKKGWNEVSCKVDTYRYHLELLLKV